MIVAQRRPLLALPDPDVRLYADVLGADERAEIIELARSRLERSTVVKPDGGRAENPQRTSSGCFLDRAQTAALRRLEAFVAEVAGCSLERIEPVHVLRYQPGQQYRPHHDWFGAGSPHAQMGGDRVGTCIVYLAEPIAGGETVLPELRLTVAPTAGHALWFAYPGNDARLLHGGEPVASGEKWVATVWVRQRPF